jgi:acetoin utilization deacetylase AcuC-like enzyme
VRVVYSEQHRLHNPRHDIQGGVAAEMVEQAERAERILAVLTANGGFRIVEPTEHGLQPVEAVHAAGLITFVREAAEGAADPAELFPDTFLHPEFSSGKNGRGPEPTDLTGRLGYWCFDTGTPILHGTYAAARAAVDVALSAADFVLQGDNAVYGLCRPPGHHAGQALFGGFCYFNNAAITADYLTRRTGAKVAVLDLDYHHGNGTQQIFYARDDVLYVSLHADPRRAYPYFSGHVDETGTGRGLGTTLNLPLPPAATNAQYLDALDVALEALNRYAPSVTIVSLGIDTYVHDPLGDFALTTSVYAECARHIRAIAPKLIVLQEGGYYLPDLGENVDQFLTGLSSV